jgi:hypothetical protein
MFIQNLKQDNVYTNLKTVVWIQCVSTLIQTNEFLSNLSDK